MSKILELKNVTKVMGKRRIVDSVSFEINSGEIFGFLGPNGAGKTTTIRMITGLIKPNAGTVHICGSSVKDDFEKALANVGAIVETPHLYQYMTGWDNLNLFATMKNATKEQLKLAAEISGLKDRLKDKVKSYSLGMKQRLGIAVALLKEPKILILDEPTNGLDPTGVKKLRDFVKKLAHEKDICIFISSHMLQEMELTCDRVIIISNGQFLAEENIKTLKEQGRTLEGLFIEMTESNGSL